MRSIQTELSDNEQLQKLGLATVQIVHDLKNQVNGLKLYATFLRKRLESKTAEEQELETVDKLAAGLTRLGDDLQTLTRLARPVKLNTDKSDLNILLQELSKKVIDNMQLDIGDTSLSGSFDSSQLYQAFQIITEGSLKLSSENKEQRPLLLVAKRDADQALIEWHNVDADPFDSFPGSDGLRMSFAARIVKAHGGEAGFDQNVVKVRLPLAT